ncbi:MAG: dTDP-4-dehydrorhamnose reductase [Cyanobacteriota bacterium]|nr:dTDP-4-dehydrorhamnose reductase [Cyanobacteriota bacterium]
MRVLLTGAGGQLGQALRSQLTAPPPSPGSPVAEVIAVGREQLDLADPEACRALVQQVQPDWLINAGAYTAVDRAEQEPALAHAVNAGAPAAFAEALADLGRGRLLQLSTDFVFDGAQGHPYAPVPLPAGPPVALGVYGASKAAAERAALLAPGGVVLRTSWVYGPVGRNFCLTMLRLHRERVAADAPLTVVADQVGCPTATVGPRGLAAACCRVIVQAAQGHALPSVLHWSDAGVASWYDFAVAIGEEAVAAGLIPRAAAVQPITTADYPTPAARPAFAVLDCESTRQALNLQPLHWREALRQVLRQVLRQHGGDGP